MVWSAEDPEAMVLISNIVMVEDQNKCEIEEKLSCCEINQVINQKLIDEESDLVLAGGCARPLMCFSITAKSPCCLI